ncbi:MAG: penicillin-binding transpeptidase domain-containing protein [Bacteroidota bacterium]
MLDRKRFFVLSSIVLLLLTGTRTAAGGGTQRDSIIDLHSIYGKLDGAFVALDTRTGILYRYNPRLCARRLSPASTFKIPNSLIALETGVIPDEHSVIPWDSVHRPVEAWNHNHDLASAIANSVVWYYQELARRIGATRMQHWVDAIGYGNRDITGGIDHFWLGSTLLISPDEQVVFLNRLRTNALPFSPRTIGIVKRILLQDSTPRWTLRGKTGSASYGHANAVGWYVGWVERSDGAVVFANCIVTKNRDKEGGAIFDRRKAIALTILKKLGAIE